MRLSSKAPGLDSNSFAALFISFATYQGASGAVGANLWGPGRSGSVRMSLDEIRAQMDQTLDGAPAEDIYRVQSLFDAVETSVYKSVFGNSVFGQSSNASSLLGSSSPFIEFSFTTPRQFSAASNTFVYDQIGISAGFDPSELDAFKNVPGVDLGPKQIFDAEDVLLSSDILEPGSDSNSLDEWLSKIQDGLLGPSETKGSSGDDILQARGWEPTAWGGAGNDQVKGTEGSDVLSGEEGNDALYGKAGDDQLYGGDGDDHLDGGLGADTMDGGKGNDVYVVDNEGDQVIEAKNAGTDSVQTYVDYTLPANVENLFGQARLETIQKRFDTGDHGADASRFFLTSWEDVGLFDYAGSNEIDWYSWSSPNDWIEILFTGGDGRGPDLELYFELNGETFDLTDTSSSDWRFAGLTDPRGVSRWLFTPEGSPIVLHVDSGNFYSFPLYKTYDIGLENWAEYPIGTQFSHSSMLRELEFQDHVLALELSPQFGLLRWEDSLEDPIGEAYLGASSPIKSFSFDGIPVAHDSALDGSNIRFVPGTNEISIDGYLLKDAVRLEPLRYDGDLTKLGTEPLQFYTEVNGVRIPVSSETPIIGIRSGAFNFDNATSSTLGALASSIPANLSILTDQHFSEGTDLFDAYGRKVFFSDSEGKLGSLTPDGLFRSFAIGERVDLFDGKGDPVRAEKFDIQAVGEVQTLSISVDANATLGSSFFIYFPSLNGSGFEIEVTLVDSYNDGVATLRNVLDSTLASLYSSGLFGGDRFVYSPTDGNGQLLTDGMGRPYLVFAFGPNDGDVSPISVSADGVLTSVEVNAFLPGGLVTSRDYSPPQSISRGSHLFIQDGAIHYEEAIELTLRGNELDNIIAGAGRLFGEGGNDTLIGSSGEDVLSGGTGIDTMMGQGGADVYVVDHKDDVVIELDEGATVFYEYWLDESIHIDKDEADWLLVEVNDYVMPWHVEAAILQAGVARFTGNEQDNLIFAAGTGSRIDGGGGWDILELGQGADTVVFDTSNYTGVGDFTHVTSLFEAQDRLEVHINETSFLSNLSVRLSTGDDAIEEDYLLERESLRPEGQGFTIGLDLHIKEFGGAPGHDLYGNWSSTPYDRFSSQYYSESDPEFRPEHGGVSLRSVEEGASFSFTFDNELLGRRAAAPTQSWDVQLAALNPFFRTTESDAAELLFTAMDGRTTGGKGNDVLVVADLNLDLDGVMPSQASRAYGGYGNDLLILGSTTSPRALLSGDSGNDVFMVDMAQVALAGGELRNQRLGSNDQEKGYDPTEGYIELRGGSGDDVFVFSLDQWGSADGAIRVRGDGGVDAIQFNSNLQQGLRIEITEHALLDKVDFFGRENGFANYSRNYYLHEPANFYSALTIQPRGDTSTSFVEDLFISNVEVIGGTAFDDKLRYSEGNEEENGYEGGYSPGRNKYDKAFLDLYFGPHAYGELGLVFRDFAGVTFRPGEGSDEISGYSTRWHSDAITYTDLNAGVRIDMARGLTEKSSGFDNFENISYVTGTFFNDTLLGGSKVQPYGGYLTIEQFNGRGGNDLISGSGELTFNSNAVKKAGDIDYAMYHRASQAVTVDLSKGTASDGEKGTDTLVSINAVVGSSFNDSLLGSNAGHIEIFEGREGNDLIDGRGGESTSINLDGGYFIGDVVSFKNSSEGVEVSLGGEFDAIDIFTATRSVSYDTKTKKFAYGKISEKFVAPEDELFDDTMLTASDLQFNRSDQTISFDDGNGGVDAIKLELVDSGSSGKYKLPNLDPLSSSHQKMTSQTSSTNVEKVKTYVSSVEGLIGSDLADVLVTSSAKLEGYLRGNAGSDILIGQSVNDTVDYVVNPTGVIIDLSGVLFVAEEALEEGRFEGLDQADWWMYAVTTYAFDQTPFFEQIFGEGQGGLLGIAPDLEAGAWAAQTYDEGVKQGYDDALNVAVELETPVSGIYSRDADIDSDGADLLDWTGQKAELVLDKSGQLILWGDNLLKGTVDRGGEGAANNQSEQAGQGTGTASGGSGVTSSSVYPDGRAIQGYEVSDFAIFKTHSGLTNAWLPQSQPEGTGLIFSLEAMLAPPETGADSTPAIFDSVTEFVPIGGGSDYAVNRNFTPSLSFSKDFVSRELAGLAPGEPPIGYRALLAKTNDPTVELNFDGSSSSSVGFAVKELPKGSLVTYRMSSLTDDTWGAIEGIGLSLSSLHFGLANPASSSQDDGSELAHLWVDPVQYFDKDSYTEFTFDFNAALVNDSSFLNPSFLTVNGAKYYEDTVFTNLKSFPYARFEAVAQKATAPLSAPASASVFYVNLSAEENAFLDRIGSAQLDLNGMGANWSALDSIEIPLTYPLNSGDTIRGQTIEGLQSVKLGAYYVDVASGLIRYGELGSNYSSSEINIYECLSRTESVIKPTDQIEAFVVDYIFNTGGGGQEVARAFLENPRLAWQRAEAIEEIFLPADFIDEGEFEGSLMYVLGNSPPPSSFSLDINSMPPSSSMNSVIDVDTLSPLNLGLTIISNYSDVVFQSNDPSSANYFDTRLHADFYLLSAPTETYLHSPQYSLTLLPETLAVGGFDVDQTFNLSSLLPYSSDGLMSWEFYSSAPEGAGPLVLVVDAYVTNATTGEKVNTIAAVDLREGNLMASGSLTPNGDGARMDVSFSGLESGQLFNVHGIQLDRSANTNKLQVVSSASTELTPSNDPAQTSLGLQSTGSQGLYFVDAVRVDPVWRFDLSTVANVQNMGSVKVEVDNLNPEAQYFWDFRAIIDSASIAGGDSTVTGWRGLDLVNLQLNQQMAHLQDDTFGFTLSLSDLDALVNEFVSLQGWSLDSEIVGIEFRAQDLISREFRSTFFVNPSAEPIFQGAGQDPGGEGNSGAPAYSVTDAVFGMSFDEARDLYGPGYSFEQYQNQFGDTLVGTLTAVIGEDAVRKGEGIGVAVEFFGGVVPDVELENGTVPWQAFSDILYEVESAVGTNFNDFIISNRFARGEVVALDGDDMILAANGNGSAIHAGKGKDMVILMNQWLGKQDDSGENVQDPLGITVDLGRDFDRDLITIWEQEINVASGDWRSSLEEGLETGEIVQVDVKNFSFADQFLLTDEDLPSDLVFQFDQGTSSLVMSASQGADWFYIATLEGQPFNLQGSQSQSNWSGVTTISKWSEANDVETFTDWLAETGYAIPNDDYELPMHA